MYLPKTNVNNTTLRKDAHKINQKLEPFATSGSLKNCKGPHTAKPYQFISVWKPFSAKFAISTATSKTKYVADTATCMASLAQLRKRMGMAWEGVNIIP